MSNKLTCSKTYADFPFAHSQPNHDGHCRFIHGHNWSFRLTFACDVTDQNGFVIDFGKLKKIKSMLDDFFDHTLVVNEEDPNLDLYRFNLCANGLAKLTVVPNCGAEGLAQFVLEQVNSLLHPASIQVSLFDADTIERHVRVVQVTCYEDQKNSATYSI